MKKNILVFAFLFVRLISSAQNDTLFWNGEYEGKNLYVESTCSCPVAVVVNGRDTKNLFYDGAFEIDLSKYKFKLGDPIYAQIIHEKSCAVKFLNEIDDPIPTVEYLGISIDSSGLLKWKTKNEISRLVFTVEQLRWNKWVKVGEVYGKGGYNENEYSFQTVPCSGENKFRVKQDYHHSFPKSSDAATLISNIPPVKVKSLTIQTEIEFSAETRYEIYDMYGNILKAGFGKTIDCTEIPKGRYFLNYDNMITEIKKI